MQESPPRFEPDKAERVKELLRRLLNRLLEWGDELG
jgi:hypothetical protein